MAADVDGAKRFYGELFGWSWKPGDHDYIHIEAAGKPIGGMMLKPKEAAGMPPHWLPYVSVDDCAAATKRVTQLGGQIYHQESLDKVGKFAICADAQGAVFSPFQPAKDVVGPEPTGRPGMYTFCWDELLTSDSDAAVKFYTSLFGWGAEHMEMPGFGRYSLLKRTGVKDEMGGDKNAGGVMKMPPGVPHPFWLTYVAVPGCDDTVAKAKKLGATVTSPPMEIPNVGRFATMLDSQHAPFAVLQPQMP
jgi:predicted enzyme related to lactoylglutathione lyase